MAGQREGGDGGGGDVVTAVAAVVLDVVAISAAAVAVVGQGDPFGDREGLDDEDDVTTDIDRPGRAHRTVLPLRTLLLHTANFLFSCAKK